MNPRDVSATIKFSEQDLERVAEAAKVLWPHAPIKRSTLVREFTTMMVSEILAGWRPDTHSLAVKRKVKKNR